MDTERPRREHELGLEMMMRGIATSMVVMAYLGLAGCGGGDDGSGGSGASESMSTSMPETTGTSTAGTPTEGETGTPTAGETGTPTGTGSSTGDEPLTKGLPEGVSTWMGQGEAEGLNLEFDVKITNSGGDLTATIKVKDADFGDPELALSGTHEPTAGRVALAPNDWIKPPTLGSSLLGIEGVYDPDAKTLTGMLVGFVTGSDSSLVGGPITLTLVDGPGPATIPGDESKSLVVGSQKFSGQAQCTGPVRETDGELVYDGAGGITGTLTVGDPGLDKPLGTFAITGVHNPSTGGITLVPGLWTFDLGVTGNFYVDGTYDKSTSSFNGDQWTATATCPQGTWKTTIQ